MLSALSQAIEARDPHTRGHSARVTALADAVAERIGWPEAGRRELHVGGALHDVGKLGVPTRVLEKPGPLDAEELTHIRAHPLVGARLLSRISSVRAALPFVLFHHERWDGFGYPSGRARDAIPEGARLLAVADAFDAMTSTRPYRSALPLEHAIAEIERCSGSQFDPEFAAAFVDVWGIDARASTTLRAWTASAGSPRR